MSQVRTSGGSGRRRRADAARSIAAILDAAIALLGERPAASMDEIARAAGVSRQTVYAHYPSRERLLTAVQQRALADAVAAIDATRPEEGPADAALGRLVTAGWQTLARYAHLIESLMALHGPERLRELHRPILERLEPLLRRARRAGALDADVPLEWALGAVLALFHVTAQEVAAGRLDPAEASRVLGRTLPRMLGARPG